MLASIRINQKQYYRVTLTRSKSWCSAKQLSRRLFLNDPDGEMELEYGQSSYDYYVNDLKEAIRSRRHLAEFVE